MTTEKVRYVFWDRVQRVKERKFTAGGRKTPDGKAELFVQSAGWYVTCGNLLSFHVGDVEPPFKIGDKVRITIEKID